VIDRGIDAFDDFAARYRKPISILAGIWFVISWASSARFISLPAIPFLTGKWGMIASSMFIGLWWGFINPRIVKRRAQRPGTGSNNSEVTNG